MKGDTFRFWLFVCLFTQIHSMDFDDTWHPATHPSGAVLPVLMALSEALPPSPKYSGLDLLLAFNVGIEVQGRLLRFSKEAYDIPKRYGESVPHPEAPTLPFICSLSSRWSFLIQRLAQWKLLSLVLAVKSTQPNIKLFIPYRKV